MKKIDFGILEIPKKIKIEKPIIKDLEKEKYSDCIAPDTLVSLSELPDLSGEKFFIYKDVSPSCDYLKVTNFQNRAIAILKSKGANVSVFPHFNGFVNYNENTFKSQGSIIRHITEIKPNSVLIMTDKDPDDWILEFKHQDDTGFQIKKYFCSDYVYFVFFDESSSVLIDNIEGKKGTSIQFVSKLDNY